MTEKNAKQSGKCRFLVVEDDFSSRFLLQKMLSNYGDVYIAVDGEEAITAFKTSLKENEPYDLICLDIMMPNKDGHETLKEIRRLEESIKGLLPGRGVKIVMVTAMKHPKDVINSFDKICNGYIFKPITKAKIDESLKDLGVIP